MRIDKFLAANGCGTRKDVKALIDKGLVTVAGNVIKSAKYQLQESDFSQVCCNGEKLNGKLHTLFLLYKPVGILSASQDKNAPCATDFLPESYKSRGFSCVGRLDKHSEGLLLLSNDGQLIHRLTQPKWHIKKTYAVEFTPAVSTATALDMQAAFAEGLDLKDFVCLPAQLTFNDDTRATVCIQEGKFHQVRRMFKHFDLEVTRLIRIKEACLELGNMESGDIRELTLEEINAIYQEVALEYT